MTRYQKQMPSDITEILSVMFERNYPDMHSPQTRVDDLARHSIDGFALLLDEGRDFYVATEGHDVAGFAETVTRPSDGGVFELLSWIMVDSPYRGHSVSTRLHESFLTEARRRAANRSVPTAAFLNVHPDNPARKVYEAWGYEYSGQTDDGTLFMRKAL